MAFYVQKVAGSTNSPSITLTLPSAPTVGNKLYLIATGYSGTTTPPSGFSTVGSYFDSANQGMWLYSRTVVSGDGASWTAGTSGGGGGSGDVRMFLLIEIPAGATLTSAHGSVSVGTSSGTISSLTAYTGSGTYYRLLVWEWDVRSVPPTTTSYSYTDNLSPASYYDGSFPYHSAYITDAPASLTSATLNTSGNMVNAVWLDLVFYQAAAIGTIVSPPVNAPLFYAIEVDAYLPAAGTATNVNQPWSSTPWSTISLLSYNLESYSTIYASDFGYRTEPPNVVKYPALLGSAFSLDRKLNLDPAKPSAAAAWGSLTLQNPKNQFDAIVAAQNTDGRGVRIYVGSKTYDPTRGYFKDPDKASLISLFTGVAKNWFLADGSLSIPIRDATYFLERSLQTASYGGSGGLDGTANLTGQMKPRARGSVQNVSPVFVDSLNRIYQWNDGPVDSVTALYEGGVTTIAFQSDVSDLYSGSTSAGYYRTNNARGLIQLGSPAQRQITLTGVATKTSHMANNNIVELMIGLLLDDMGIDPSYVDSSFAAFSSSFAMLAGYYQTDAIDGATLLGKIAQSIGAQVYPKRNGKLAFLPLRTIPASASPVLQITQANCVSLTPVILPSPLEPPPKRWQIGYAHNYTTQTSDLNSTISSDRRQFVSVADRFVVRQSSAISTAYRNASDPPQLPTMLANSSDAGTIADAYTALWCTKRRLYDAVFPVPIGLLREIGDVVKITWPMDDLSGGRLGQIVGDSFKGGEATITLRVLV